MAVTIGHDYQTKKAVEIGDIERRSGLYILGKPGDGEKHVETPPISTAVHRWGQVSLARATVGM
jgi:hypothetical protein